jgi:hypothetical protein
VSYVFDFASAISISALAFIFPAWFYFVAEKKFGNGKKDTTWRCTSVVFLIFGVFNFLCGMSADVISII